MLYRVSVFMWASVCVHWRQCNFSVLFVGLFWFFTPGTNSRYNLLLVINRLHIPEANTVAGSLLLKFCCCRWENKNVATKVNIATNWFSAHLHGRLGALSYMATTYTQERKILYIIICAVLLIWIIESLPSDESQSCTENSSICWHQKLEECNRLQGWCLRFQRKKKRND